VTLNLAESVVKSRPSVLHGDNLCYFQNIFESILPIRFWSITWNWCRWTRQVWWISSRTYCLTNEKK